VFLAVAPLMRQFYGLVFIEIISWGIAAQSALRKKS
jgi:hypothetical protein